MKTINIPLWSELGKGLQLFPGNPATPFLLPRPRVVLRWDMSDYIGGEGLSNGEAREDPISVAFTMLSWELLGDTAVLRGPPMLL